MTTPPLVSERPIDILLVEDQPHDAELALRALRELDAGRTVQRMRDGASVLDFFFGPVPSGSSGCSSPIDTSARDLALAPDELPRLVLLDLKLPKVSGVEVLKALKSDARTRDIPIVVLTSSREACDVEDCYASGANSYVVKPVDFVHFRETVQRIGTYWLDTNEPLVS